MTGATFLLAVVLLLYSTSMLVMRFASGTFRPVKQPITWFYLSWIVGLVMLALPMFEYQEKITGDVIAYIAGALAAFSMGAIASVFVRHELKTKIAPPIAATEEAERLAVLTRWLLILGLIGTALLILNTQLAGTLSFADRLDAENASRIREEHMGQAASQIGPLFGPASLTSATGGLGVAFVMYFLGRGVKPARRDLKPLAIAVLALNCIGAFIAFGSRMFAVFFPASGILLLCVRALG